MKKNIIKKSYEKMLSFIKGNTDSKKMKAIALGNNHNRLLGNKDKGLEKPTHYSFKTLRQIAAVEPIIRISINVIKKTVSQSKWQIKVKDRFRKSDDSEDLYRDEINQIYDLFDNMNENDENMRILLDRIIEDILTLDAGAIEVVRSMDGKTITQLNSVDGASVKPIVDEYGNSPTNGIAYKQYVSDKETASFKRDELVYIMANPQNSLEGYGYGVSPIESIMLQVQASLDAELFNMRKFSTDNVPAGLLDLGDIADEEAENVMATWNASVIGNTEAIKFMWGSGASRKYIPFQGSNKDMQFSQYLERLAKIVLATYGLTAQDANITQDINRSTAEVYAAMSNTRGVRSMKRLIEEYFTRMIVRKAGESENFKKLEFTFVDIETLEDKETQAKIDKLNIESGIYKPTFVQERDGYPINKELDYDEEYNDKLNSLIESNYTEEKPKPKKVETPKVETDED